MKRRWKKVRMSFTPLPKTFIDFCGSLDPVTSRNLELGCGDGCFQDVVAGCGVVLLGLDLVPPARGSTADIVGDVIFPPLFRGSLDLVVAPNLLRHLFAIHGQLDFLEQWLALLKPGGSLFIFEDEPGSTPPGAEVYRKLQAFLRLLMPESRGPLLSRAEFLSRMPAVLPGVCWEHGMVRNRHHLDCDAVLEFLGRGLSPDEEKDIGGSSPQGCLMRDIARDGLDPGHYWWARATSVQEG